jgi:hypothetical protein
LIGDYGRVLWTDEDDNYVAAAGSGGYQDFTENIERNISSIESVYPLMIYDNVDSGNDTIYGNGERDVIIGGGGLLGEFLLCSF